MNCRVAEWFGEKLNQDQLEKLTRYQGEIQAFNPSLNLVSAGTEADFDRVHLADALLASWLILSDWSGPEIYDLGSGNGIPGMVLAVLSPQVKVVLVDKDRNKCEFLKHIAGTLELPNVEVREGLTQAFPEGRMGAAVSRGFASLTNSLLQTRKAFVKGAVYYHLKSEAWVKEAGDLPIQLLAEWAPKLVGTYRLPETSSDFSVIKTTKLK